MTPRAPKVSVVVPAFKQAHLIDGCLDSIAAQTYTGPVEVIVVDDGSPDDSGARAARHRVGARVVRQDNGGAAAARNRGIAESSGDYLAFVDADDRWLPDKLSRQIARLQAGGKPALCFTCYRRVDSTGTLLEGDTAHPAMQQQPTAAALAAQNFIGCSTVMVHRSCIERVGGFPTDEALRRCGQDYALWLRVAAYFPLIYLREVHVLYTVHQDNRVGVDRLKHFSGGLEALHALYTWSPTRAKAMVGLPLTALVARRAARFAALLARDPDRRAAARDAVAAFGITRELLGRS